MSTPASVAKHPIHPMLVVFPIGLWIFSLVCDVISIYIDPKPIWSEVALYCIGGGIVGAVLAAIPGLIDLLSIHERRLKTIGVIHMIINLVAVVLFGINFGLRLGTTATATVPFILSIVTVIGLGVSGWLGGELVYVHGVGVEPRQSTEASNVRKVG